MATKVLVFGASTTQGFWDTEGGWVQRLRNYYDTLEVKSLTHRQPIIFNLGVSGDTTQELLARFAGETRARLAGHDKPIFIFSIGGNNAREENGQLHGSFESYRRDLDELLAQAKQYSDKILFVGLSACDESRTTPVSWRNIDYRNENIWKVEQLMRATCHEQTLPHVPVFEKFVDAPELLADGLHPNNAGHKLIAELVRTELDKLLAS